VNGANAVVGALKKIGKKYTIPDLKLTMLPIKPGSFMMGSTYGDSDEKPVHKVTLTKSFWMGCTEVTQAQWSTVMGADPSRFKGDANPVDSVSWNDCVEFCKKLTARERAAGRISDEFEYRLPTEAEWEYCARGGAKSKGFKYGGSDNLDDVAWYYENSGDQRLNDDNWSFSKFKSNNCKTHPVAQKRANELGLYDMSGNVWEWCGDKFGYYTSDAQVDPTGPKSSRLRVFCGGSWRDDDGRCRVSYRLRHTPVVKNDCIGLRIVRARVRPSSR